MTSANHHLGRKGAPAHRRVVVLVVPPVDEFDLVCPVQVFSAANRLSGKTIYSVEIATNGKDLQVPGEAGLLSFLAAMHYSKVAKQIDSVLLVCGVATQNA